MISPASGETGDQLTLLSITPSAAGLAEGKHTGTIEFIAASAGVSSVAVELCVAARPVLSIQPDELSFSADQDSTTLLLRNTGTGFLHWELRTTGAWYKAEGHYGFFDSTGTTFWVLVKAEAGSGAAREWAVAGIDVL